MPAERFYLKGNLSETVTLEGTEFHHLAHVMRVRIGEVVELVNGEGAFAKAELIHLAKTSATLKVLASSQHPLAPKKYILAVPILRMSKLEFILEKCTELGADSFWLYPAQHSEKGTLSPNQLERLYHICISAMKQCGRLDLPSIELISHFEHLFRSSLPTYYGDTTPDAPSISFQESALFISGPESGFSPKEKILLKEKSTGISLHKNILRAETAPMTALILLQKK